MSGTFPQPQKIVILPLEKRASLDKRGYPAEFSLTPDQASAANCAAGVVRLLNGVQGRSSGFGAAHIESNINRMKQIEGLGFKSLHSYIRFVFDNVRFVGKQEDGRIVLVSESNGIFHHVIGQWDDELRIWSVTTAIPKRNMRDVKVVWEK